VLALLFLLHRENGELGELGHFLIFIAKEFNVKKNVGLQIE
jgi:hypothetical protein